MGNNRLHALILVHVRKDILKKKLANVANELVDGKDSHIHIQTFRHFSQNYS